MKKILFLFSSFKDCGPLTMAINIAKNLSKDEFHSIFVSISNEKNNTREDYIRAEGIEIVELNINRLLFPILGYSKFINIVKRVKPNIIHSHLLRADFLNSIIKMNNVSRLSTLHNQPYLDYSYTYGRLIGYLTAYIHIKLTSNITTLVSCSNFIKNFYDKRNKSLVKTIQVGVRTDIFSPVAWDEKQNMRSKLKIETNAIAFIVLGNIVPRKNISAIINAFESAQLPKNAILLIAGDGEERAKLESISYSKNIKFVGRVVDAREYLLASDYYISASLAEGLPAAVIEAMSCGLPVILSDIPSHKEIFEGVNYNLFFNPSNSHELKKIIEKVIYIDISFLSKLVNNIAHTKFSYKDMAKKYTNLYRSIS